MLLRRRVTRAQSQTGARMPVSYVELHTGAPLVSANDIAEPAAMATESQLSDDGEEDLQPKKKKVGRPIAYKGDINSPHLTEAERRRIKRWVLNRPSSALHLKGDRPTTGRCVSSCYTACDLLGLNGLPCSLDCLYVITDPTAAACIGRVAQGLMHGVLICRRVANRESARRVRQKRQETMEELQLRMSKVRFSGAQRLKATKAASMCNTQFVFKLLSAVPR